MTDFERELLQKLAGMEMAMRFHGTTLTKLERAVTEHTRRIALVDARCSQFDTLAGEVKKLREAHVVHRLSVGRVLAFIAALPIVAGIWAAVSSWAAKP